ncbi:hypothetical protein K491DRAFT_688883 [Lophiostoma macrostomum CBS 122681]|uniref:Uncharacterized protein n=1 Tax=Lophiostoma macrostomum CBS 122681 TaxID=1314788 RepID=A0A6A6TKF7_9PLEO|nr:hypothetical protein K491DRAFT_688883 [Lophiostoma macrostomum CBS 122681]
MISISRPEISAPCLVSPLRLVSSRLVMFSIPSVLFFAAYYYMIIPSHLIPTGHRIPPV